MENEVNDNINKINQNSRSRVGGSDAFLSSFMMFSREVHGLPLYRTQLSPFSFLYIIIFNELTSLSIPNMEEFCVV